MCSSPWCLQNEELQSPRFSSEIQSSHERHQGLRWPAHHPQTRFARKETDKRPQQLNQKFDFSNLKDITKERLFIDWKLTSLLFICVSFAVSAIKMRHCSSPWCLQNEELQSPRFSSETLLLLTHRVCFSASYRWMDLRASLARITCSPLPPLRGLPGRKARPSRSHRSPHTATRTSRTRRL